MNQQLDEIKRLAEEVEHKPYAMSVYISSQHLYADMRKDIQQLATHCLRLVAALEKCREQRNGAIDFLIDGRDVEAIEYKDQSLTKILEGKDE